MTLFWITPSRAMVSKAVLAGDGAYRDEDTVMFVSQRDLLFGHDDEGIGASS